jgi:hypothetical protein
MSGYTISLPIICGLSGYTITLPIICGMSGYTISLPIICGLSCYTISFPIICGLSCYTISLPIISKMHDLRKKVTEQNVFWFLSKTSAWNIFILRRIKWYIVINLQNIGLHVKYPSLLSGFHETRTFLGKFSKKYPNINFYGNPPIGSGVVPCGGTGGRKDERVNMTNGRFTQLCERS